MNKDSEDNLKVKAPMQICQQTTLISFIGRLPTPRAPPKPFSNSLVPCLPRSHYVGPVEATSLSSGNLAATDEY